MQIEGVTYTNYAGDNLTWLQAERVCQSTDGAHLLSIESHEKWVSIHQHLPVRLV